ncbi:uncharacterized protein Dwil_GK14848 [Drosophila willistoni]|uniref:TIR domain-containing protein n=1 Tax=Drosophila willistoni TaxID=7260 RepID=B4MWF4_DROWI|nr:protein toll [Drosophila willistoni]EDW76095.1 uncharacterized protein Dwil_GK14848 [Drosophila willistoni]
MFEYRRYLLMCAIWATIKVPKEILINGQVIPLGSYCQQVVPPCGCESEANVVRFHCPDEYSMLLMVTDTDSSLYVSYYADSELGWVPRFEISDLAKIEFDAYSFWPKTFLSDLLDSMGVTNVSAIEFRDRRSETVVTTRDIYDKYGNLIGTTVTTESDDDDSIDNVNATWQFSSVPGLTSFKFASDIEELPESIFEAFDTLTTLNLCLNVIHLPDKLLSSVSSSLQTLTIQNPNMLRFQPPLLRELKQLRNLTIELTDNQYGHGNQLQPHLFSSMRQLEEVYLSRATSHVDRKMFRNSTKLQLIKIKGNENLDTLPSGLFKDQSNLTVLDISCNSLSILRDEVFYGLNNLHILDLSDNRLTALSSKIFAPLTSLNLLLINRNSLTALSPSTFSAVSSLNFIDMRGTQFYGSKLAIEYEALVCFNSDTCQYKSENWSCDPNCICWVQRMTRELIIDCRGSRLNEFPALPHTSLVQTVLKVANNSLTQLPDPNEVLGYSNVSVLLLANNQLTTLGAGTQLPGNLSHLDVRNNQITVFNTDFITYLEQDNNTMTMTLSGNPVNCDCSAIPLLTFIRAQPQRVQDIGELQCTRQNKPFQQMEVIDLCPSYVLLISCIVGVIIIVVCLISVVYLMYQQELKIWLYNNNLCLWWVSEEELDKDKTYDAFISYSHKDEELIAKLLPKLENGPHPFRVCLHGRDWLVGDCIPEQIVRTVDDSKRVIIILSQHFIDSVWARMEFRIAYQATLQDKRKRIIIILYKELENMDGIDSELKAYLKLNTYLKWGDPLFWSKLCYAMPHNRRVLKGQKKHAGPLV